jgi:hypothetical protein
LYPELGLAASCRVWLPNSNRLSNTAEEVFYNAFQGIIPYNLNKNL